MIKLKLLTLASLLVIVPASLSDDEVQKRPLRNLLFLNEIEHLVRNANALPNEDLTASDASKRLQSSEHASGLHGDSNDITPEYKLWQYRSDIEDFPTNVRKYKIYNPRGRLAINKQGQVYTTSGDAETKFKMLLYNIRNGKYRVRLQNEKHHQYLAISCKTGIVYSTTNKQNLETILMYLPMNGNARFRSEKCPQNANDWYLGVNKDGSIKNAKTASVSGTGTKFLLIPV